MLTHGLLAIEMVIKLVRFTSWETSFRSFKLLEASVKVTKLVGRYRSHNRRCPILFPWSNNSCTKSVWYNVEKTCRSLVSWIENNFSSRSMKIGYNAVLRILYEAKFCVYLRVPTVLLVFSQFSANWRFLHYS